VERVGIFEENATELDQQELLKCNAMEKEMYAAIILKDMERVKDLIEQHGASHCFPNVSVDAFDACGQHCQRRALQIFAERKRCQCPCVLQVNVLPLGIREKSWSALHFASIEEETEKEKEDRSEVLSMLLHDGSIPLQLRQLENPIRLVH
jgi:hypothetical protein